MFYFIFSFLLEGLLYLLLLIMNYSDGGPQLAFIFRNLLDMDQKI